MTSQRWIGATLVGLLVLGAAGCGGGTKEPATAKKSTPLLVTANKVCGEQLRDSLIQGDMISEAREDDFLQLGDGGHTLTLSSPVEGAIGTGLSISTMSCLLDETKASDAVKADVQATTALMGRQHDSWGKTKLTWSYHPDTGVNATFESK